MLITRFFLSTLFIFIMMAPSAARAQEALPALPDPIQNLVNEGAQIRYLGKDHGLNAWVAIKQGQEQYFYVLPDNSAFVMGVLFDTKGKMVTVDQVRRLRARGDDTLDALAGGDLTGFALNKDQAVAAADPSAFKTPSERLYFDVENSNWLAIGDAGAPVVYSFIDPQCSHCHAMVDEMRKGDYFKTGKIQLRMIPVGFREETMAQAAFLLATPDPAERWFKHLDGDESALPAKKDINQQGVQRNLAVMQSWELNVTPLLVYRAQDKSIKIVRGRPKDLPALLRDLGGRG